MNCNRVKVRQWFDWNHTISARRRQPEAVKGGKLAAYC